MSSPVVRQKEFTFIDYGEEKTWRLKKWSAIKLLSVVRDLGGLFHKAFDGISEKSNELQIFAKVAVAICESDSKAINLVILSVDKPALTADDVSNMEAECFVGILCEILEYNLTGGMAKKFKALLASMLMQKEEEKEAMAEVEKSDKTT